MFFLISFVLGNNYCIETTIGRCEKICKNQNEKFDQIFSKIPGDEVINSNEEIHNFYIADDVSYFNSMHNFILCDPSIHLIYEDPISSIRINKHIIVDSDEVLKDVPILFKINNSITIEIDTEEKLDPAQVILEPINEVQITTKFYVEQFPKNLILISPQSNLIHVRDKTESVLRVYNDTSKLILPKNIQFYCISDKDKKCSGYRLPEMNYINSLSEITGYDNYVIVDTSTPQQIMTFPYKYYHFFLTKNSEITCSMSYDFDDLQQYVILHTKSIETYNMYLEGEGKFTLMTKYNISFLTTTKNCKIDFGLKTDWILSRYGSYINPIKEDFYLSLDKKIDVPDYSLYRGPEYLKDLFEPEKYLKVDEDYFYLNVTLDTLKEIDYLDMEYYLIPGTHEIPVEWKKPCRIHGMKGNETNLVFSDVHSFDGYLIDDFIECNIWDGIIMKNNITVKPSHYFYLDAFYEKNLNNAFYTILIENDIYMYGPKKEDMMHYDDLDHTRCKIIGNGNIMFNDPEFKIVVEEHCMIDENVHLIESKHEIPPLYACIGQTSLDKCKSEIPEINSLKNYEWVWLRNLGTNFFLRKYLNVNFEKVYLTDKHAIMTSSQFYYYYEFDSEFILTSKAEIKIDGSFFNPIRIYKNQINDFCAINKNAKITVFMDDYKYRINLDFHESPTQIDFNIYLIKSDIELYMKYIQNYVPNSIQLYGKCDVYIRDYLQSKVNLFKKQDTINFKINNNDQYEQLLFSDEPQDNNNLTNFILCKTYEEYNNFMNSRGVREIFVYKSISLNFSTNSSNYDGRTFNFYNIITVNVDVPRTAHIFLSGSNIYIYIDEIKYSTYYLYNKDQENKFLFDVKDSIYIDISGESAYLPKIEFIGSKHQVEVFPSPSLAKYSKKYKILVHEDLTIISPCPQYVSEILSSVSVGFSPNWSYVYLSEEGKKLYQANPYNSFHITENDENYLENVILAVGKDDVLSVPEWTRMHYVVILQEEDGNLYIDGPKNVSFFREGLQLNNVMQIFNGNIIILASNVFTLNVKSNYYDYYYHKINCYNAKVDCLANEHTNIYLGFIDRHYYDKFIIDSSHIEEDITFYYIKKEDWNSFRFCLEDPYLTYDVHYYYDYICYYNSESEVMDKCPEKSFHVTSNSDLNDALIKFSEIPFIIGADAQFYGFYKENIKLYITDESTTLTMPNYTNSLYMYLSDKIARFGYSSFHIYNKSHIIAGISGSLYFNIQYDTQVDVTFILYSDVFLSTDSKITSDTHFTIIKNSYHLYAENYEYYDDIFGDLVDPYIKLCIYDLGSYYYCRSKRRRYTIDDFLDNNYDFHELEIVVRYQPKEITLPQTSKNRDVYINSETIETLTLQNISNVTISSNLVTINDYWQFSGNTKMLIHKLENNSIISKIENSQKQITFQLANYETCINLNNWFNISAKTVNFVKYENEINKVKVFGSLENYVKFANSLDNYDGVDISYYAGDIYLCICKNEDECEKCKSNVDGVIFTADDITDEPGPKVGIRIFSDVEISSNVFINEHNVFVDESATLNLTDVNTVYQNLQEGIKIDSLIFDNANQVILKPKSIELNIIMRKVNPGPAFYVEVRKFLKLNVINFNEENVQASRLYVYGYGELHTNNYPIDKITNVLLVKIYKGVYIICNDKSTKCNHINDEYVVLGIYNNFKKNMNPYSKIIVFLSSFENNIDANLNDLDGQKIDFDRNLYSSKRLLNEQSKLRFTTTTELINKEDLTTKLASPIGGALLDNSDSDLFIVGFESNLTIKQEGNISSDIKQITIQPMNEEVTIFIDDSVDLEKQKIKIKPEENKGTKVKVVTNQTISDDEILKKFIENEDKNVTLIFENVQRPENKKKGLPIGAIIGIVIGAIAVIAVIIVVTIYVLKNKSENENEIIFSDDSIGQIDDSTF